MEQQTEKSEPHAEPSACPGLTSWDLPTPHPTPGWRWGKGRAEDWDEGGQRQTQKGKRLVPWVGENRATALGWGG